jgi:hypothetical protein
LDLAYGSTKKGTSSGFNLGIKAFVENNLAALNTTKLRGGAIVAYQTMGISNETFGGFNTLLIKLWGEIENPIIINQRNFLFNANIKLSSPFTSGTLGVNGKKYSLSNASNIELASYLLLPNPEVDIDWGGTLEINSFAYKAGSKNIKISEYYLGALVRYRF